MFYGEFEHTLDQKGRIIIPAKFREIINTNNISKFYATRGLDRCLFVFTEAQWLIQSEKFKQMSFTRQESRQFNRLYFSGACEFTPDKQGRILIPQYLKDYAEIKEQIMITGIHDRIEIWSLARWKTYFEDSLETFEQTAEKLID